jgi:hypothetical protein
VPGPDIEVEEFGFGDGLDFLGKSPRNAESNPNTGTAAHV